jgi:glycine hydroxymethyltransferase
MDPSGARLGTPAITSRGMGRPETDRLATWMGRVARNLENETELDKIAGEIRELCASFPALGIVVD